MAKTERLFPDTEMGGRIQKLRRQKGLERVDLHERVFPGSHSDGYKTVSNWESGATRPKYEEFISLCDILECDADYLLCRQDTPRKATVDIMNETGLSEKSVSNLCTYNDPNKAGVRAFLHGYTQAIDFLLSHPRIENLLMALGMALKCSKASLQFDINGSMSAYEARHEKEITTKDLLNAEEVINASGNIVLSIDDVVRFYAQLAGHELQAILSATIEQKEEV